MTANIYIGSDHGGFILKKYLIEYLTKIIEIKISSFK